MFSSTEQIGLARWQILWRILLVFVAAIAIVSIAEPIVFRVAHKAPLGRSARDVTRALLDAFPPGTRVDSALSSLRRLGVEADYTSGDSALFGVERNVAGSIVRTDVAFWGVTDAHGRIAGWVTKEWYTGP